MRDAAMSSDGNCRISCFPLMPVSSAFTHGTVRAPMLPMEASMISSTQTAGVNSGPPPSEYCRSVSSTSVAGGAEGRRSATSAGVSAKASSSSPTKRRGPA